MKKPTDQAQPPSAGEKSLGLLPCASLGRCTHSSIFCFNDEAPVPQDASLSIQGGSMRTCSVSLNWPPFI